MRKWLEAGTGALASWVCVLDLPYAGCVEKNFPVNDT